MSSHPSSRGNIVSENLYKESSSIPHSARSSRSALSLSSSRSRSHLTLSANTSRSLHSSRSNQSHPTYRSLISSRSSAPSSSPSSALSSASSRAAPKRLYPSTFQTYDIVSNKPLGAIPEQEEIQDALDHSGEALFNNPSNHWIPKFTQKDFDIINNRYLYEDANKPEQDMELLKLKAAEKHHQINRFNPILQRFIDPEENERIKEFESAYMKEQIFRKHFNLPPSDLHRQSAHYNLINNHIPTEEDAELLKYSDEASIKDPEYNKHRFEQDIAQRDELHEQREETHKLNKIAYERYKESVDRGFDIVNNIDHFKRSFYEPYNTSIPKPRAKPRLSGWDRIAHLHSSISSATARSSMSVGGVSSKKTNKKVPVLKMDKIRMNLNI
jgi:hypothetical protein